MGSSQFMTSIIAADLCIAQVSQLILNFMEANCPLDESIDSLETLRLGHPQSNGDSEANISRGDREATSLGEEV